MTRARTPAVCRRWDRARARAPRLATHSLLPSASSAPSRPRQPLPGATSQSGRLGRGTGSAIEFRSILIMMGGRPDPALDINFGGGRGRAQARRGANINGGAILNFNLGGGNLAVGKPEKKTSQ